MSAPRKPAAFRIEPENAPPVDTQRRRAAEERRPPRAIQPETALVTIDEIDAFDTESTVALPPPPRPRRSHIGALFLSAISALLALAFGLWTDRLIADLFSRAEWLGWAGVVLAGVAVLALLAIVAREMLALLRLASMEKLRQLGADAIARDDPKAARKVVAELTGLLSTRPESAAGRRSLADLQNEIIDGADLVRLAETELLLPLDIRARALVLDAAKRVSLITAVSPRALVDIAYVVFEAGRLIRRLSELYGGRPGTLGFVKLARSAIAHLAVTGSIAAGDSVVQQLVGHSLAARLSAKLGEGVVNGMMTARIGLAAMEIVRPLPFTVAPRPKLGDFLSALTSFATKKAENR